MQNWKLKCLYDTMMNVLVLRNFFSTLHVFTTTKFNLNVSYKPKVFPRSHRLRNKMKTTLKVMCWIIFVVAGTTRSFEFILSSSLFFLFFQVFFFVSTFWIFAIPQILEFQVFLLNTIHIHSIAHTNWKFFLFHGFTDLFMLDFINWFSKLKTLPEIIQQFFRSS